jgi:O-antigen/teichoic acid export membrane protein
VVEERASKRSIERGVAWVGVASSLVALADVVALALILRYWVTQEEFGIVTAVVTIFPALTLLAELGLPAAVIQGSQPDDRRLSSVFWLGFGAGGMFYAIVFFLAPVLADAQGHAEITDLFRVTGLVLLIRPAYTTHRAILRRQLRFKELSVVRMIANTVEFGVKVGAAAGGLGVWCFALAPIAREVTYAIATPIVARWRPRLHCRPREVTGDIRFGLRTSASEMLYQAYSNLDYQIVSVFFGAAALGLYRAAYELVIEPVRFVSEVVTVVAFPTFSRLRHDRGAVIDQFVAFTRQNLIVVLSLVSLIVVAAGDLLTVVIGPQYEPAATAARVLAVVGVFRALSHLGPPLLDGLGRPDLTLRYQLTAALVLSTLFIVFAAVFPRASYLSVAVAWAIGYPIAFGVLLAMVFDQMNLRARELFARVRRIIGLLVAAAIAGGVVHAALAHVDAAVRLGVSALVVIGGGMGLLVVFGELKPRAIVESLRSSRPG